MISNKINPVIKWDKIHDKDCLYFKFTGFFSLVEATQAIIDWKEQHDLKKGIEATIIWDCADMENYDDEARKVWRLATLELSDSIEDIWVITDSVIVLAFVEIISFFTKKNINIAKTQEELYKKLEA